MSDKIAIKVDNVSKTFRLPHEKNNSIKGAVLNFYKRKKSYEKQQVLKDISFEIKEGEFFGIVGRNGSGKSTLLKLLAGIYSPSKGKIQINGMLTPFIELGVGFNPELTGRENVFLNGALLGFSRNEMHKMYKEIVEFAELERFMDQKLKNYSSGMQVRLAFSIAIRAKTDVLLLDEVLAVGDADFQRKCLEYFNVLKRDKKTVVFVTHDMESVKKFCDKVILIDEGRLVSSGSPQVIVPEFMSIFVDSVSRYTNNQLPLGISSAINIDETVVKINRAWLEDYRQKQLKLLEKNSREFYVCFEIEIKKDIQNIIPGIIVTNDLGEFIIASNTKWSDKLSAGDYAQDNKYLVRFKILNIYEQGNYNISVNVVSKDLDVFYAWKNNVISFYSEKTYITGAKTNPKYDVEIQKL